MTPAAWILGIGVIAALLILKAVEFKAMQKRHRQENAALLAKHHAEESDLGKWCAAVKEHADAQKAVKGKQHTIGAELENQRRANASS